MNVFRGCTFVSLGLLLTIGPAQAQFLSQSSPSIRADLCVGGDCLENDSFDSLYDQLKLKANNTQLVFEDSSTTAGFPSTDWILRMNENFNGGRNQFVIRDETSGTNPFIVSGSAPTNSVFIASNGRVGLGTATPAAELDIVTNTTEMLRVRENNSGADWTFSVGSTGIGLLDRFSGSSAFPFLVENGAPNNAFWVEDTGNVGLGTSSPQEALHIRRNDGTASLFIQDTVAAVAPRTLFTLANPGNTKFEIMNTDAMNSWAFTNSGNDFRVSLQGSGVVEFRVDNNGNAFVAGDLDVGGDVITNLAMPSDRALKENIVAVNPSEILERFVSLDIARWNYRDKPGVTHLGPMAQDFFRAFGMGSNEETISVVDASGVALAAIKALKGENDQLRAQNEALEARLAAIEARLMMD